MGVDEKWTPADRPRAERGKWTKKDVRPEKIARARKIAILMRAGGSARTIGLQLSDRAEEMFTSDLAAAELVNEGDISKHVYYGTRYGKRRPLTERQAELLQEYADGLSGDAIAAKWACGRNNVNNLTTAAKFALDAGTIAGAVATAVAAGFVKGPPLPVYATEGAKPSRNAIRKLNSSRTGGLSPRQLLCLHHIAGGLTAEEIGAAMLISEQTVASFRKQILAKLGAAHMAHAVALAYDRGVLPIDKDKRARARAARRARFLAKRRDASDPG